MTELHDLWKEYDKERKHLLTLEDRREYFKIHFSESKMAAAEFPEVHRTHTSLQELRRRITSLERNFEKDYKELFTEKAKESSEFSTKLWSALANVNWEHEDGSRYSCSFRYAGALVAEMREEEDGMAYMNWYCSGPYASVSEEIAEALAKRGWSYETA